MVATTNEMHVLIVGAGLTGLLVAHGLKKVIDKPIVSLLHYQHHTGLDPIHDI